MKKATYTQEQIDQVLELYNLGNSPEKITKIVGFHKGGVIKIVKENGKLRTNSEGKRAGKGILSLKEDVFDVLTPDALYWIGFLYADGHIEKNTPHVTVTLSEKDKAHLEKFNQFMGGYLNVREVTQKNNSAPGQVNHDYRYYRVAFNSKQVHSKLIELGFSHNKTYDIIPHPLLKFSRDFWRGAVDGDGWICSSKREDCNKLIETIGLCGNEISMIEFISFIELSGIKVGNTPSKRKDRAVWSVEFHSAIAKKVGDLLYKDSSVYLERKYQKYLEFFCE